ncbi:CHAT domain-containing protein [Roseomonas sp. SSH11]|uniref:CHAT domain-containing protein n=1 Tax=Pararoseomonas baculiformis TaxID=2820812 RepID=A0ABS4AKG6_9PROT|nr:CHAT domain-containing tetratricopeptide repeat protein [Pararoseomonas baculiformis]MBP0447525.1 CHAT domain-containing protein [Pararoseomonas baculiformis]
MLNRQAVSAHGRGSYPEAVAAAEQAAALARQAFGARDPRTLTSLNNLGFLYHGQGRLGEAEPLLREALQLRREVLGPRHPDTLASLNNLAGLYRDQGRLGEAEPLLREALEGARAVLGERHPDTLASLNNLALLYDTQGRLGEAEPLLREALEGARAVLGERHPDTLVSLNNLGALYLAQGRLGEAEPLLREALQLRREVLGERHPSTLTGLNNLASLYHAQGRLGEAEPHFREALRLHREVLGERHPDTLISLANLALLYHAQGRLGEAEPLLREALQLHREVLSERHPETLISLANLALLYHAQGRLGEAEPLYREALEGARAVLGPAHPSTLLFQLNHVSTLARQGRVEAAVRQLRAMEPHLLSWLGAELYSSESPGVRRQLVASQANFQHLALSLALQPGAGTAAAELAASAVLRFKGLQAEEEAYLARIARRGTDPRARDLSQEIAGLRGQLARLFHSGGEGGDGSRDAVTNLTARLAARELALGRVSRDYAQHLQVRGTNLGDLQAGLAPRTALLEIREYRPFDFRTGRLGPPRWAGVLVSGDTVRVLDLGPVADSTAAAATLLRDIGNLSAAQSLHQQLIAPVASDLAGLDRLFIAPDGVLHLVPFAALGAPDGRRLAERADIRLLQTGRDLLRPAPDRPASGLVALGGIEFGQAGPQLAAAVPASATSGPVVGGVGAAELRSRTEEAFRAGFGPLPHSGPEVEAIAALYRLARRNEPVEVWTGREASEARLKALPLPPRVLHLATHGFYRAPTQPQDRPMLLAGIALAGANGALRTADQDGVLYAIEAQDLNLEGTELVILSACETARGQVDYGEGVSGLVRALRTAGARSVLVTLQPVGDRSASEFMERFYFHWLGQAGQSDPAAALRAAQLEYIRTSTGPAAGSPIWAQFTLVGG